MLAVFGLFSDARSIWTVLRYPHYLDCSQITTLFGLFSDARSIWTVLRCPQYLPTALKLLYFRRIRKIAKSDYLFLHVCPSVRLSVCPHGTTRLPLDVFSRNFAFE
jgi:hypothetical protein